jgi:aminomethyltransferase
VQLYSVYNHTYHPRHYGDPVEEYYKLLEGVTLWDVGVEKQIEISGPDAFHFTQLLVARDLNKCAVEQCKYVFLCTPEGGIINDPVLLRVEENRFWLSLADSDVELWARGVAVNAGMDVQISELDVGPVQVQGPRSKDVMVDLFGDAVLEIPYYYLRPFELDGMRVLVSRTGYTSELGYEIYLYDAYENGVKLWDAVLEAGKPHDLAVIGPCHIRRIEAGILALPVDMNVDTNPYEVGMGYDWMVDLEQATEFIGKEALTRIKREGAKRQLIGVEISGPGLGSYNDGAMIDVFPVHHGGERVGEVTSACYSPRLEKNIGFAMVPTALAELGTELEVDVPSGRESAVVVPKPFIDAEKATPKQALTSSGAGRASSARSG